MNNTHTHTAAQIAQNKTSIAIDCQTLLRQSANLIGQNITVTDWAGNETHNYMAEFELYKMPRVEICNILAELLNAWGSRVQWDESGDLFQFGVSFESKDL